MNLYRTILSFFLLSAYVLFLLHDFIPHTHHNHHADIQITSTVQHSHGDHQHTHEHHEEEKKNDQSSESSDKNSSDDHLIHIHNHSDYDGHHHDLVYRAVSKDKLIPYVEASPFLVENAWKSSDWLDCSAPEQYGSLPPPSDAHLSSGHGLRAPPALG